MCRARFGRSSTGSPEGGASNYTYDLKIFFEVIPKLPQAVTRQDCVEFLKHQQQAGLTAATINRRLAAASSLFNELELLNSDDDIRNPVQPRVDYGASASHTTSLYRRQAQRIPETIPLADLQRFFEALPTWRDRALILLMWISCLRISEVVGIRWGDLECSHRSIRLPVTKGNHPRIVFIDQLTFGVLNRYLDGERQQLFPEAEAVFIAFKGKARGQPLTVNAVQKLIAYYAEQCDLPYLHAHLFRHTGLSIKQVSHRLGYSDSLYFSRVFRKHRRISPSLWRRRHIRPHTP